MSAGPLPPIEPAEGYRPHLDGLRALAVYLVVLFHAGSPWFRGGFVGVDVFFVLSGYLVTQVLWRDLAGGGAIRFGRFYARRFRRLLPAAFVALTVTALVYRAIASPSDVAAAVRPFQAAFLFVANWVFIHRSTTYFGGDIAQNPVLHFWSLGVEEQFYLAWPLLLAGLVALGRRAASPLALVRLVVGFGAAASLLWALLLRGDDPIRAYYGTDTRAYQLLAGAFLALTPGVIDGLRRVRWIAPWLGAAALLGIVVLASALVPVDPIVRGAMVTVVAGLAIAALEAADGLARRLLSSRPAVYLGKISYGTYLWQWPVVLVITVSVSIGTPATVALTMLVASALASLSFQLLEHPIRQSPAFDARRAAVIATGLAVSAGAALALMPAILRPDAAAAGAPASARRLDGTRIPADLNLARASFLDLPMPPVCLDQSADACTVVKGSGPHLLLLGDSHARMLMPTFMKIARREDLTLSVLARGGCPWQRHLSTRPQLPACEQGKEDAYTRVIPALKPDVIIAVNYGYDAPHVEAIGVAGQNGLKFKRGMPQFDRLMREATLASIAELEPLATAGVVIVEPIPLARRDQDPTACLVRGRFLEECRYVAPLEPSSLEQLYREIDAQNPRVWSADFDRLVCPWWPVCDPVVGGRVVKVDSNHLTAEYSIAIAEDVAEYLKANGLIPAAPAASGP